MDSLIGHVLNKLSDKGMLENTVVLITGDHGQEFNENKKNYWGHSANYSDWQIRVPLVFYYPNIEGGKKYSHMTTHYDITPTLMRRFLGVKNPSEDYSMGYDLNDTANRYPHVVGDPICFGFVLEDMIISLSYVGQVDITDRHLNPIPRNSLTPDALQKSISKKNLFYK